MLLQINNTINKRFLFNFLKKNNYFFVFNVENFKEVSFLYDYFMGKISHSKQFINFFDKDKIELFAGNTFFCFVDFIDFFKIFLDLVCFKNAEYNLNLVGICYNNYFLNFNLNYLNVFNCLYLNLVIVYFLLLLFVNLFLFKFVLLLKQNLFLKKC